VVPAGRCREGLATRLAGLRRLICALDLGELAERAGIDLAVAGGVYFEIERRFAIDALRERIGQGEADFWQERARTNLENELGALGAALTAAALASEADPERLKAMVPKTVVERWAGSHGAAIERYDRLMDELTALEAPGFPMLTVALGEYASWRGVRWRAEAFIPHRMRRLPFNFPLVRAARSKSDVHSLRQRRLRARR